MAKKTANILFRRRRAEANPVAARKSIWVAELVEASVAEYIPAAKSRSQRSRSQQAITNGHLKISFLKFNVN